MGTIKSFKYSIHIVYTRLAFNGVLGFYDVLFIFSSTSSFLLFRPRGFGVIGLSWCAERVEEDGTFHQQIRGSGPETFERQLEVHLKVRYLLLCVLEPASVEVMGH